MKDAKKTLTFKIERKIPAAPAEVFDGWLDPKVPGTTWNEADKFMLDPKVDGLFFWRMMETPHYGRFTKVDRPSRIEHTWMSPNTMGAETSVTVTFKKQGNDTLMTLVHAGLPNTKEGKSHERGWNYFLGSYLKRFEKLAGKKR
jgi:uncharacterized protein YndB with AHSA1/START domain